MTQSIPQTDPRAGYLTCREEIDVVIQCVLQRGRYILGEEVESFEKEFAQYLGVREAVGVSSGTDALYMALCACGIGPGDEVITVSLTAVATVAAIERCGAKPVFVDVDAATYTLAPDALYEALSLRTKAIVPVHLYGLPADMAAILAFARERGLRVIEDCAQAHGAVCRVDANSGWKKVGTFGDAAAFSFYPTKNLAAFGDGGCVVSNNSEIAEKLRLIREYGWGERFVSTVKGWNCRLDEMQAAILRVKLRVLDAWNEERRKLARIYDSLLDCPCIIRPLQMEDRVSVYHQYVIQTKHRDRLRNDLAAIGIGTAIHYPLPVHLQPAYQALGCGRSLNVTQRICSDILSLPMYPQLGAQAAEETAIQLLKLLNKRPQRQSDCLNAMVLTG